MSRIHRTRIVGSMAVLAVSLHAAPQKPERPPGEQPFTIGAGNVSFLQNERSTAVGYDNALGGRWLVAHTDVTGLELWGQLLTGSGVPVGPRIDLQVDGGNPFPAPTTFSWSPKIATVDGSRTWVVGRAGAYSLDPGIRVSTIDATGNQTPEQTLYNNSSSVFDVGGGTTDTSALFVIENGNTNQIVMVTYDANSLSVTGSTTLTTPGTINRAPAISPTAQSGRYFVTWVRGGDIWGAIVTRNRNILVPPFPIATGGSPRINPDVDGDGLEWAVVWGTGGDLECATIAYDPTTQAASVRGIRTVANSPQTERRPKIVRFKESYLLAYERDFGGGDYDVWVQSLETLDCESCEGTAQITTSSSPDIGISLAIRLLPAGRQEALIAWANEDPEARLVRGNLYVAADGRVANQGGACGIGGGIAVTCASATGRLGIQTRQAAANAPAALLLGPSSQLTTCGGCLLTLQIVASVPAVVDETGIAQLSFQLNDPTLVGAELHAQWLVAAPGPCAGVISMSNGAQIWIE